MSLIERMAEWMRTRVENAGSQGIVLGLSGGVDSACVAGLARRALGDAVLGVLMPCHSQPIDAEYGQMTADAFGVEAVTVDLSPIYDAFVAVLPPSDSRLAHANLKPRLRMTTLYYLANVRNYLVAGTGNKSEILVGYFTKYGDGGVDILPLADLYKRQVYDLARQLGVPQPIIDRPPTAGLWAGQTDEEEMGLTYQTLERALLTTLKGEKHNLDEAVLAQVRRMVGDSAHKRAMPPAFEASG